jgi:hypothetical protein
MAEPSTGPTQIVGLQFGDTNGLRGLLHYVPNRLYRHAISPCEPAMTLDSTSRVRDTVLFSLTCAAHAFMLDTCHG